MRQKTLQESLRYKTQFECNEGGLTIFEHTVIDIINVEYTFTFRPL